MKKTVVAWLTAFTLLAAPLLVSGNVAHAAVKDSDAVIQSCDKRKFLDIGSYLYLYGDQFIVHFGESDGVIETWFQYSYPRLRVTGLKEGEAVIEANDGGEWITYCIYVSDR
ncbi:hypothetical protein ADL26_17625 [Thermoactinomyces vulgaris]|jgi:hypothetical protein|uniref:Uncharacterized protein n=1 Tax=Laceyella tengchongensis TaxID=574699 RepID=A0AA45WNG8_9BACL|nr:hypothetical protein [Laceyella tengchongensis]KPC70307.1 hypothetical protein ADL26_17625 [Thermoactinomyces vulgaris]SMP16990.1 hypothetical protein SAMN06265361_10348 [Laceyella tengchongensis]